MLLENRISRELINRSSTDVTDIQLRHGMAVKSVLDRLISSRDIQFSTLLHVQTRRMLLDFVVNLCVTVTVLTPRSPAACILSLTDSSFILTMKEIMVRRLFKTYLHLQFLSESKKNYTLFFNIYF